MPHRKPKHVQQKFQELLPSLQIHEMVMINWRNDGEGIFTNEYFIVWVDAIGIHTSLTSQTLSRTGESL